MSRRKELTTLYLEPEQKQALLLLSKRTRVPMAVYVRDAVDELLKKYTAEAERPQKVKET